MYIFDGLLLIISKKRHFKARILQNLLKNKNCLLIEPQMARNINLIKTGQRGKKWGFSAIHRTSNTRRKSNLHPHQSQFTLSTLQRDTLYYCTFVYLQTWPVSGKLTITTLLVIPEQPMNFKLFKMIPIASCHVVKMALSVVLTFVLKYSTNYLDETFRKKCLSMPNFVLG